MIAIIDFSPFIILHNMCIVSKHNRYHMFSPTIKFFYNFITRLFQSLFPPSYIIFSIKNHQIISDGCKMLYSVPTSIRMFLFKIIPNIILLSFYFGFCHYWSSIIFSFKNIFIYLCIR